MSLLSAFYDPFVKVVKFVRLREIYELYSTDERHNSCFNSYIINSSIYYLYVLYLRFSLHHPLIYDLSIRILRAAVVQLQREGLQVNRSIDRSCTWGMMNNKIHVIYPLCPRLSIAVQCRILA